jgi:hypothetical protein
MSHENPSAYREAQNRIRDMAEREKIIIEDRTETFEKWKEKIKKGKKLDRFELRRRIETGHSLNLLKQEIREAFEAGSISVDTYRRSLQEMKELNDDWEQNIFDIQYLPFSQSTLAQYFENKKIGESIFTDIGWFLYGFWIQGTTIIVILLWKILVDTIFLPKDIYKTYIQQ